ncbi:MAG: serine acetyltransferase, partial [Clostridia bacterium]|nr:serine acetyltransferase [Clostridia bacterium]
MKNLIEESIVKIVDDVVADYDNGRIVDNLDVYSIPSTDAIIEIIGKLLRILYPGYHIDRTYKTYNIRTTIATVAEDVAYRLCKQIALALKFDEEYADKC